jgi:hypothetical protein
LSELKYCRIYDALSTTFSHDSPGDRKGACLVSSMFTRHVFVNSSASTSPLPVRPFLCSQSSAFDRGSERDNVTFLRCQCSERDQSVRTGHCRNIETVNVVRNCARNQLTERTRISLVRPHRSLWRGCCRVLGSPPHRRRDQGRTPRCRSLCGLDLPRRSWDQGVGEWLPTPLSGRLPVGRAGLLRGGRQVLNVPRKVGVGVRVLLDALLRDLGVHAALPSLGA